MEGFGVISFMYLTLMCLTLLLVCFFAVFFCEQSKLSKAPIKEISATIINMEKRKMFIAGHYRIYPLVTFKLKNESLLTLNVSHEIYNKIAIGQQGILSYRERKGKYYFVYFSNLDAVNNG